MVKTVQKIVLLVGALGVFHSSLVPPVRQGSEELCRYHEFLERVGPFARLYDAAGVDGIALLTEYGLIVSLTAIVYLVVGLIAERKE